MIDVKVQKFFIIGSNIVQLELLVDGLQNIGHKKIDYTGKDPNDALLCALSSIFGYKATDCRVNYQGMAGQSNVVIDHKSKKYEGSALFQSYREVPDSVLHAYFDALGKLLGDEIKVQLPPINTPYEWAV